MAQVKRRMAAARKSAATNDRNFRTFLLVSQLEAEGIGARIAQARNEAGLTQEELADLAVGFSRRSLQDYEAGVTIPYKHLREISALLGREVKWFLHGDSDQQSPDPPPELADLRDEVHRLSEVVDGLVASIDQLLEGLDPPQSGTRT